MCSGFFLYICKKAQDYGKEGYFQPNVEVCINNNRTDMKYIIVHYDSEWDYMVPSGVYDVIDEAVNAMLLIAANFNGYPTPQDWDWNDEDGTLSCYTEEFRKQEPYVGVQDDGIKQVWQIVEVDL